MAVSVSMHTPIPDYQNFGENITRSWISGQELALDRSKFEQNKKVQDATLALNQDKHAMAVKEYEYQWKVRETNNEIARKKYNLALEKESIKRDYMRDRGEGGKYESKWWHGPAEFLTFGYYDPVDTEEEYYRAEGIDVPEHFDLLQTVDPSHLTHESIMYARQPQAYEGTVGGTDSDLLALSGL